MRRKKSQTEGREGKKVKLKEEKERAKPKEEKERAKLPKSIGKDQYAHEMVAVMAGVEAGFGSVTALAS